ncbi:MAG: hypothetical protein MJZ68_05955 [archaeon]|nr:hypothetical protein [archaeon]
MSDEQRYDDPEMQRFYEENREKIDRLFAEEKERSRIIEEARARAYFDELEAQKEEEMRRYEELRKAREEELRRKYDEYYATYGAPRSEKTSDTEEVPRDRVDDVFDRIDKARERAEKTEAYAREVYLEERARIKARMEEQREKARISYEERKEEIGETVDRIRDRVNEGLDNTFGFVNDPKLQQHMVGAGLEMWMALNALVKAGPFPNFMKETLENADRNKNVEYCRKNSYCRSKKNPDAPRYREGGETYKAPEEGLKPVTIVPITVKKEEEK